MPRFLPTGPMPARRSCVSGVPAQRWSPAPRRTLGKLWRQRHRLGGPNRAQPTAGVAQGPIAAKDAGLVLGGTGLANRVGHLPGLKPGEG
jgi:hypothetical protein